MRKVTLAGKQVELYDAIDELPVLRFHKFNKMLLIDTGVGSDLSNVDNHIDKAIRFIKKRPDDAIRELENLRQSIFLIQSEISPNHLAFCVLVKSIDGVEKSDISDDALKKVLEELKDATHAEMTAQNEAVKKKITDELHVYFPGRFDDASVKEFFDLMRNRTIAILDSIIDGEDKQSEIERLTNELITYTRPEIFAGEKSIEVSFDKQFESLCLILSQNLHIDAKKLNVLEYYNAFEYLKKAEKESKATKRK